MAERFEPAYAYARACGSLARSFLGERAAALAASPRVGDAWRGLFASPSPALPEGELADAAELAIRRRSVEGLKSIVGLPVLKEPFFAALTRRWEFAFIKTLLSAAAEHASAAPVPEEGALTLDAGVELSSYPDLERMLRKSRYRWVADGGIDDLPAVKNGLDKQYYAELWEACRELPPLQKGSLASLLRTEAELENLAWTLRLKRYYSMGREEVEGRLIELRGVDVRSQALRALGFRLDSRSDWSGWKWERLVPDSRREEGGEWYLDLRLFELEADRYLYRLLYRRLHLEPDSYTPMYAYFRLKEFESTSLCGLVEGIKLEAGAAEIAGFASAVTGARS
jgi:Archaeal/vacuolar-type H+-ATPase subunit C